MTPRAGLKVAAAGLTLAVLCAVPLWLLPAGESPGHDAILGIVLLDVGVLLALVVMAVGLTVSLVTAFAKRHRHRL
jgi:hypothetical protein